MVRTFIIKIRAAELVSVTGTVKGKLQEYFRRPGLYPDAVVTGDRKSGILQVAGVPREALEEGLRRAWDAMSPQRKFRTEIEESEAAPAVKEPVEADESDTVRHLQESFEREKKELQSGYESYIDELERTKAGLEREKESWQELERRLRDQVGSLSREKGELTTRIGEATQTIAKLQGERVMDPVEAASLFLAEWSPVGSEVDANLTTVLGNEATESTIADLLPYIGRDPATAAKEELAKHGHRIESWSDFTRLLSQTSWEQSQYYIENISRYRTAVEEVSFLDALDKGTAPVPESIANLIRAGIQREEKKRLVAGFEEARKIFEASSAVSGIAQGIQRKIELAGSLGKVTGPWQDGQPVPLLVACRAEQRQVELAWPNGWPEGPLARFLRILGHRMVEAIGGQVVREDSGRVIHLLAQAQKRQGEANVEMPSISQVARRIYGDTPFARLGLGLEVIEVRRERI